MQRTTKKITVTDVINVMTKTGDVLNKQWEKNKDLKTVQASISAYGTAISAAKAQLIYKKLTGNPDSIEFFSE